MAADTTKIDVSYNVSEPEHLTLDSIGKLTGTDKSSLQHGYLDFYHRFLRDIRFQHLKILEIGVFKGQSVRMWELYFPNAEIVGLDINPETLPYSKGRIKIEMADQNNTEDLARIAEKYGAFDLIIDDGSHIWEHQVTSLRCLFGHVKRGGFYIVEDLQVCFPHSVFYDQCRRNSDFSTVDYFERLTRYVIGSAVPDEERDEFLKLNVAHVEFVASHHGTVLLRRKLS